MKTVINLMNNIYKKTKEKKMEWKPANTGEIQRLFPDVSTSLFSKKVYFSIGKNRSIVSVGIFESSSFSIEGEEYTQSAYLFSVGKINKEYSTSNNKSIIVDDIRSYNDYDLEDITPIANREFDEIKDLYNIVVESQLDIDTMVDDF